MTSLYNTIMKKQIFTVAFVMLLLISIFVIAQPGKNRVPAETKGGVTVVIPSHAIELATGIFDLGTANVNGEVLQGYMFIHYKDEFTHKPNHDGATTPTSTCYAFLSQGARWKNTEQYITGPGIDPALTETSLDAWDSQVAFDIFGSRNTSAVVDGTDTSAPDNKNEIMFGDISSPNVIAVTTVWGIFGGKPNQRKLVEFDAVFDNVDFTWGNAGPTSETSLGDTSVMDFQNIATHEFGHAAGMGHPSSTCAEETMYAYSTEGETKKRTLNAGDISGIKSLYK